MNVIWFSVSLTAAAGLLAMHVIASRSQRASRFGVPLRSWAQPKRLQPPMPDGHHRADDPLSDGEPLDDPSEEDLREALTRQQFVLHYQPEVSLANRRAIGLEALVRWQHPSKGLLPPGAFIDGVEQSDLIIPLGRWVLEEACLALSRLQREHPRLGMSINVSPRQLEQDSGWVEAVESVLARTGVAPGDLTLEITETALMLDAAGCRTALQQLREVGIGVAIDDFGTGYSSLSYLNDIPASLIKLDKRFVDKLEHGARQCHIVSWIRELAGRLEIAVTAEGVETAYQSRLLQSLGYTRGQGFYFCRPGPEHAILDYLHSHARPFAVAAGNGLRQAL